MPLGGHYHRFNGRKLIPREDLDEMKDDSNMIKLAAPKHYLCLAIVFPPHLTCGVVK